MNRMDLLIFDLDGTLIDSKQDLCCAVNATRAHCGLPPLANETVYSYVGEGAPVLMRRTLGPGATGGQVEEALAFFLAYYNDHMIDHTVLYPGVRETLDRLLDCKLAVLTNKPVHFSCAMLDGLGIYRHFVSVYGGNSFDHKKPDPVGVYQILSDTKGQRERTWIVGDSAVDVQTGRNAAIRTCGVTYGYATDTFKDAPPDFLIDNFPDLEALVHD